MKKVIPCLFTSGNLCFGVLSMILSSQGNFFWGALCIFFAMLCDAMDGRSARALGVSGEFGKELDSLSDCVSFGAASAFLMYNYTLHTLGWIGVIPVLIYSALGGIRLARFNINTGDRTRDILKVCRFRTAVVFLLPMSFQELCCRHRSLRFWSYSWVTIWSARYIIPTLKDKVPMYFINRRLLLHCLSVQPLSFMIGIWH